MTSLAVPATAAAGDEVIATLPAPTPLDAYAGRVVWSEPSPQGYRLVEYRAGTARQLPIAPRARPFDVDLGPGPDGSPVAVYSRCAHVPVLGSIQDGRRGCDLYLYDFALGREVPVKRANGPSDETSPTIWRNRIAFARTFRPKGKNVSGERAAYWRPLSGRGPSRRLGGRPRYLPLLSDLDMRGARVAPLWGGEWGGGEVRLTRIGGRTVVLGSAPGSGAAAIEYAIFGVSLLPRFAYWAVTQPTEPPEIGQVRRYDLLRGAEQLARTLIGAHSAGFAQDGGASYYLAPRSETPCTFGEQCVGPL